MSADCFAVSHFTVVSQSMLESTLDGSGSIED